MRLSRFSIISLVTACALSIVSFAALGVYNDFVCGNIYSTMNDSRFDRCFSSFGEGFAFFLLHMIILFGLLQYYRSDALSKKSKNFFKKISYLIVLFIAIIPFYIDAIAADRNASSGFMSLSFPLWVDIFFAPVSFLIPICIMIIILAIHRKYAN